MCERGILMKDSMERYHLIKASSGFGKTTYMREYIRKNNLDAICLELTSMCNEKYYFCKMLIQLLKKRIFSNKKKSLDNNNTDFSFFSTSVNDSKKNESSKCYVEELLHLLEYFESFEEDEKYIVLDNVQVLKNQGVTELVESMMKYSASIKWCFIGREKPDFLVKYYIQEECKIVEEKQLFLTKENVLSQVKSQLHVSKQEAEKLTNIFMEYFHGWAAGIGELIRYVKDHQEELLSTRVDWESVILKSNIPQYIEREICAEIPKDELKFLRMFTILPQDDEELGSLLLQESGLGITEEELEQKYFFLQCQKHCLTVWQGFRVVLRQMQSNAETKRLKQIITKYYISRGEYQKANVYMLKSGDFNLIQEYLIYYKSQLCSDERMGLAVDCILFLLESGKPLLNEVLGIMGRCYQDKDLQEQKEFFLALLSYNEDPMQMKKNIMPYFYKVRKECNVTKKIRITNFGNFKVKIVENGKEVSWRTKKGCELFAYLYSMHGTPISRQDLMNMLWEYEIPKNAVTMLHNMIYNIRKELAPYGLEEIICYKDKMYSLEMDWMEDDLKIWSDIGANVGNLPFLLEHEKWLLNYPGPYMGNIDSQWAIEQRSYYDNKYIEGCMKLATHYINHEKYKEAQKHLKNILLIDNLREEAIEKLLYCHGKLGERKQVQQEYAKFSQIIKNELNVEPCKKVKVMYDVVMKMEQEV